MRKYTHGGDVYKEKLNIKYDFSANINPLGMPENAKKAIVDNISNFEVYPDPFCRILTQKIAEEEKVDKKFVLCGNGAADLIYRLVSTAKPKDILVMAPTFSEYEEASTKAGAKIHRFNLENFYLKAHIIDFIKEMDSVDIVFICNPNNPTGILSEREILLEIAKVTKEKDALLVIDQCFLPFVEDGDKHDMIPFISDFENLIVLKAFTKIYSMAGLRLGYMISSNEQLMDELFSSSQPWSVSSPAQVAGVGALSEKGFVEKTIAYVSEQRKSLEKALKKEGFIVIESKANYICFKTDDGYGFRKAMLDRGILIRDCSNYYGLDENYSRIAVRTKTENEYFIDRLEELKWQRQ